jgi:putative transposase
MKIKLSAHGAYHHQYHVVWIPKYRKKVLKGELKQYLEKGLFDITTFHPDIEIETWSIQVDHMHLVIVIPPKYAVSDIVGKIKANTSRGIRKRFPWMIGVGKDSHPPRPPVGSRTGAPAVGGGFPVPRFRLWDGFTVPP